MGFKVKGTPERDNFEVKNSKNDAENKQRLDILNQLSVLDIKTLQTAYLYAKNYVEYGVNVTEKWVTACQNSESLERAYHKGYCECYERMRQDYRDKLNAKFGLDSADQDLKACTDEKKESKFKYEIGQIVRKKGGYPNTLTFEVVDRYMVNLIYPYYKIHLYCVYHSMKGTSYEHIYEYVPEHSLDLPSNDSDEPGNATFKFHVGDIVKFKRSDHGLYKIFDRYEYANTYTYKIGDISNGCWTVVNENQLELVSKR